MVSLPELARRGDVALRDLLSRVARRAGWTPTVLGHPGYGSGGRVRVLGRVLLAPVHPAPQERRPVAGWQRLLTLESPRTDVTVELAGQRFPACSDDDGLLDVTLDVALPDTGAVPVVIRAGERASRTVVHLASPDAGRGVVCDIDDTVLVTGIATPLAGGLAHLRAAGRPAACRARHGRAAAGADGR